MAWTATKILVVGGVGSLAAVTFGKMLVVAAGEIVYGPSTSSFAYDGRWVGKIWGRKAEK